MAQTGRVLSGLYLQLRERVYPAVTGARTGSHGKPSGTTLGRPTLALGPWLPHHRQTPRSQLQSRKLLDVLSGANACAVRKGEDWEVIQFCNAELIAPLTYKLTKLLRGQLGTEHLVDVVSPADAEFVLLNPSLLKLPWSSDKAGVSLSYRVVPAGKPLGYKWAANFSHTGTQTSLKPLAPVSLKATVQANGDLELKWIRRTRWEGDSWAVQDIPLHEDNLQYSIRLHHVPEGETEPVFLQVFEAAKEQLLIQRNDLLRLLGSGSHVLSCQVAQNSTKFGLGTTSDCQVSVTL